MAKPKRPSDGTGNGSSSDNVRRKAQLKFRHGIPPTTREFITTVYQHYLCGHGFREFLLVPDDHLSPNLQQLSKDFLDQARLLDLISRILVATSDAKSGDPNPTLGMLDFLIELGAITNTDVVARALESDALMLGHEDYVVGLGWPRQGIVRTDARAPLFRQPIVRVPDFTTVDTVVPGIYEHDIVYFRSAPGEPEGKVPAYPVTLRATCGLKIWESATVYSKLSGKRRDYVLSEARMATSHNSREVKFKPREFWRWYNGVA